jgi:hypothetical protein
MPSPPSPFPLPHQFSSEIQYWPVFCDSKTQCFTTCPVTMSTGNKNFNFYSFFYFPLILFSFLPDVGQYVNANSGNQVTWESTVTVVGNFHQICKILVVKWITVEISLCFKVEFSFRSIVPRFCISKMCGEPATLANPLFCQARI